MAQQQLAASGRARTAPSRRLWYAGWAVMAAAAIGIAVFAALPYFSGNPQMSRIPLNPDVDLHLRYLAAHGIPGALALLIGPFQFLAQFQFRYPIVHRNLGRVYLISVGVSVVLAFVAASFNTTGLVARVGFFMLATVWAYTAIQAYVAIRRRQIQLHRIWMIRNYALTLSAVFLRIFIATGSAALPSNPSLTFEQVYDISIWASWTTPFVIAELFVVQRHAAPARRPGLPARRRCRGRSERMTRVPFRAGPVGVALIAVLLTACNSSDPMGNVTMGTAEGEAIAVKAIADQSYDPAAIEVPAGQEVTFEIRNADTETHDFAIASAGLNTGTIQPNATATATLVVPEGTTTFVCTFHEGMGGTIEGV